MHGRNGSDPSKSNPISTHTGRLWPAVIHSPQGTHTECGRHSRPPAACWTQQRERPLTTNAPKPAAVSAGRAHRWACPGGTRQAPAGSQLPHSWPRPQGARCTPLPSPRQLPPHDAACRCCPRTQAPPFVSASCCCRFHTRHLLTPPRWRGRTDPGAVHHHLCFPMRHRNTLRVSSGACPGSACCCRPFPVPCCCRPTASLQCP